MAIQSNASISHDAATALAAAQARQALLSRSAGTARGARADVQPGRERQMLDRVTERFGPRLDGHAFGIWGVEVADLLADSPLVAGLLRRGATLRAHDPLALPGARNACCATAGLLWMDSPLAVAENASALLLMATDMPLRASDLAALRALMTHPVLFDAQRQCDPSLSAALGFVHVGAGRPMIDAPAD